MKLDPKALKAARKAFSAFAKGSLCEHSPSRETRAFDVAVQAAIDAADLVSLANYEGMREMWIEAEAERDEAHAQLAALREAAMPFAHAFSQIRDGDTAVATLAGLRITARQCRLLGDVLSDTDKAIGYAWVIEKRSSLTSSPDYWTGGQWFAKDYMQAIRFSRKTDAVRVGQQNFPTLAIRICEHGWEAAAPNPEAGKLEVTKEWCENMARREEGSEVGAGYIAIDPQVSNPEAGEEG